MDELLNENGKTEKEILESNEKLEVGPLKTMSMYDLLKNWEDPNFWRVMVDGGYIELRAENKRSFPYDIEISRIQTEHDVFAWVYHLSEKKWVTGEHINKFIKIVCDANDIKIPRI